MWLDMADPDPAEVWAVGEKFGLDALSLEDVLDTTLLPKVDDHGRYLFVVLHGVLSGEERLSTTELDLFIGEDFLITVHYGPVVGVEWIADRVTLMDHLDVEGPGVVAAMIAEAGSRRYLPLLDALDERIVALEEAALAADPRVLAENQALRRDVIVMRRILGPQRDVLHRLSSLDFDVLGPTSQRNFGDGYDHNFRLVESFDASRALLASVLETYRGAVAERTNEIMKVLTVFSAILLPLALIAGLWGMNFNELPGEAWRWGFLGILGSMAGIAIGLWLYFVRRGFVGGPRLRDLPKSVGLSLVSIGTAPLRAMTRRMGPAASVEDGSTPGDRAR